MTKDWKFNRETNCVNEMIQVAITRAHGFKICRLVLKWVRVLPGTLLFSQISSIRIKNAFRRDLKKVKKLVEMDRDGAMTIQHSCQHSITGKEAKPSINKAVIRYFILTSIHCSYATLNPAVDSFASLIFGAGF